MHITRCSDIMTMCTAQQDKVLNQGTNLVMHQYQFSPADPIPILFRQEMANTDTW